MFTRLEYVWMAESGADAGRSGRLPAARGGCSGGRCVAAADSALLAAWAGVRGWRGWWRLAGPFPAEMAEQACAWLNTIPQRATGLTRSGHVGWVEATQDPLPSGEDGRALRELLRGRRLFAEEAARLLPPGEARYPERLGRLLELLRLTGRVRSVPGVRRTGGGWRCARCGSREVVLAPCPLCGDPFCPVCAKCAVLGQSRACRRLYFLPDRSVPSSLGSSPALASPSPPGVPLATPAQASAAQAVLAWLAGGSGTPRELLLWAVCGAGKTRILAPALVAAVGAGWRTLYASPRREVVAEVGKQYAAWPGLGNGAGIPDGRLVIATTHQALRYDQAFDLIVVDEPDAFPYRGEPVLAAAVRRALKPGGRLVHVTATPESTLLRRAEHGEATVVFVPERFHGRPHPEPEVRPLGPVRRGVPSPLGEIVKGSLAIPGRRCLIFVPTVVICQELAAALSTEGVWAADPSREGKEGAFAAGTLRLLVATPVLERGVTFPNLDVVVYHAEHPLFDAARLVQMAGRAGRAAQPDGGGVWFLAARPSSELKTAQRWIRAFNAAAAGER